MLQNRYSNILPLNKCGYCSGNTTTSFKIFFSSSSPATSHNPLDRGVIIVPFITFFSVSLLLCFNVVLVFFANGSSILIPCKHNFCLFSEEILLTIGNFVIVISFIVN